MKSRACFPFISRTMAFAVGISILSATITFADKLYFTQDSGDNDTLMMVTGLTRGTMNGGLGSEPGFKATATGSDGIGAIDAAMIGGQPRVATGGQIIHLWDGNNISYLKHASTGSDSPVREILLGEIGGTADRLVIARETDSASTNILLQMFEASTMSHIITPGPHANIGNASGMALGNFTDTAPGNEIVISTTNIATVTKAPGFQLYVRGDNLGWLGQQPINQPISDVAAGDLVPGLNNDEAIFTGNIGGDSGPGYGQQSHVFSTGPGFSMDYQLENGGGGPHGPPPGGLLFNAVDVGQLDADPELEIALVGNDVVRVLNHDGSFVFQTGPTTQNFVDVVIADAMDNDGVNEIVAVSDSGLVFAYGHSVVGDASSALSGGPLGFFNGGAPFTAVASLVPEPGSLLMLVVGLVGLAMSRRR